MIFGLVVFEYSLARFLMSDDDVIEIKERPDKPVVSRLPTLHEPMKLTKKRDLQNSPFDAPLVNVAHSIAYAFSPSNIDPFANLLKLLHQRRNSDNDLFFQLTQTMASDASPTELLPSLIALMESDICDNNLLRKLVIQSFTVLSVNNPEFSRGVLEYVEMLLQISEFEDNQSFPFLSEVLSLFEVACEYAEEEQARIIIANFAERDLIKYQSKLKPLASNSIRAQVHAVLAKLAIYGNVFPDAIVLEIIKRCNYPGRGELSREIMWPSAVAIELFLRQPGTRAYAVLDEKKSDVLGKLALAVGGCEKKNDPELKIMTMKVFLEACDEFRIEDLENSLNDLQFCVVAAVVSMQNFSEEEPVRRMAETIIRRFNL